MGKLVFSDGGAYYRPVRPQCSVPASGQQLTT